MIPNNKLVRLFINITNFKSNTSPERIKNLYKLIRLQFKAHCSLPIAHFILFFVLSSTAFAQFSGGSGTSGDPYQVATPADLDSVRNHRSSHFIQTANIDLSSYNNWTPIGTYSAQFTGNYNGDGYYIYNLTINTLSNDVGLFGSIGGGAVLINILIDSADVVGGVNVGILAGIIAAGNGTNGEGTIVNCSTKGVVNATARAGGLVGSVQSSLASVFNSFSMADVSASGPDHEGGAGGLVGFHYGGGIIRNCFATGNVSSLKAGGLVGDMFSNNPTIQNCFALGNVSGSNYSGGLVGLFSSGTVTDCFYNSETTGQSDNSGKGMPLTSSQMRQQSTFTNWDFTNTWKINEDLSYPYLKWQPTYTVTYNSNGGTGTTPNANQIPGGMVFVTANASSLIPPAGKIFKEWNTSSDGTGMSYAEGDTLTMPSNSFTFYAVWEDIQPPTVQASKVSFSNISANYITISWTNGDGLGRIVLMKEGNSVDSIPVNLTEYNDSSVFGSGDEIGSGNFVVYKGSGNSVKVTGLTKETLYSVAVFEYNGSAGSEIYLTDSPATGNTETSIFSEQFSITGIFGEAADWGDYNNDGLLDFVVAEKQASAGGYTKVYRNTGSGFTEAYSLTGIIEGDVKWGDYDNDGLLDILLTGNSGNGYISKVYHNTGSGFVEIEPLLGAHYSSCDWGDYNNDGLLDILLTGFHDGGVSISRIYKNTGNGFTEAYSLPAVIRGSAVWGDYNNDGLPDILLTGETDSGEISKIYRNTGSGFTEAHSLTGFYNSSAVWGDYDNDGLLDILLTGHTGSRGVSKVYRNTGSGFTEVQSLTGVYYSSAAWGDYDNDGLLDILLTGHTGSTIITKIYRNTGSNFSEVYSLTGVYNGSAGWGDYNNDGRLDILITGTSSAGGIAKVYKNEGPSTNSVPAAPGNLQSSVDNDANEVTLSWDKSTDNETPQNGLNYNIVVGTSSNGIDHLSPMANRSTGSRKIVETGNSQTNQITLKEFTSLGTYYWSVQTIDNAFAGSPFAAEGTFDLSAASEPSTQASGINFSSTTQFATTINWTNGDGSSRIVLLKEGSAVDANPVDGTSYSANTLFEQGDEIGAGNFVIYNGTGNSVSVSGLNPSTTYHIAVYEYNGSRATLNYRTSDPARGNQSTQAGTVNAYAAFTFSGTIDSWDVAAPTTLDEDITLLNGLTIYNGTYSSADSPAPPPPGSGTGSEVGSSGLTPNTLTGKYRVDGFYNAIANNYYVFFKIIPANGTLTFSQIKIHHPHGSSSGNVAFPKEKSNSAFKENKSSAYTGFGNLYKKSNPAVIQSTVAADGITVGIIIGENSEVQYDASYNSSGQYWSLDLSTISTSDSVEFRIYPTGSSDSYLELNSSGVELLGDVDALPVELTSFTGGVAEGNVVLNWQTETEVNNYGFEVQRSEVGDQKSKWEMVGFVQGNGTTNSPKEYSFIDSTVSKGEYFYRLKQIDLDGAFEYSYIVRVDFSTVTGIEEELPLEYNLSQNFPNPFNPVTQIKYDIPEAAFVTLKVYDIQGAEVVTIVNERKPAGRYSVYFNAANLASGVYLYALNAGEFSSVKKLIVLK